MIKTLITGSEGNIGSRLIPYLESMGHTVFRFDQVQKIGENYMVGNINNNGDLAEAFRRFCPAFVIHLAAMVSRMTCEDSPYLTVDTNLSGLNNVIQLSKSYGSKLMYFSTSEVYGNIGGYLSEDRRCEPNNRYGLTKYLGEKLVEYETLNGLKAIIVRPFMFYDEKETRGEHRSAMIRFAERLYMRNKITVHKDSLRSWLYIRDAVQIIENLLFVDKFEIVNIGSQEVIKTQELARLMCEYLDLCYGDYVIEEALPQKMTLEKYPDIRKQTALTGIMPVVTIDKGIKLVLDELGHN